MNIIQTPSPNFNSKDRNGNDWIIIPKIIIIHWTVGNYDGAVSWLCNPSAQVSAHFVIDHDGNRISQLVDLNRRAWHCGGSFHPSLNADTNSETIGIECEGPPSFTKTSGWSTQFIDKLVELCKYIKQQVPSIIGIADHSTIDPLHKVDVKKGTGIDTFPWDNFIKKTGMIDLTMDYSVAIKKHFSIN